MPIKTIQPFVSNFNAFAGEGFYGNVVQGLVIKQLEDAVFIFGIAIDGTLIFRKRNYPDVSTWEDPKIIIHSNNWHKIYFVTDLGELMNSLKLFPFMNKGRLTGTDDLNNVLTSGIYEISAPTTGVLNGKDIQYGILIVFSAGQRIQLLGNGLYGNAYFRTGRDNGRWYDWVSIYWHKIYSKRELGGLLGVNETWFRNRGNIRGEINLDDFKDAGAYSLFNIEGNNVPTSWAQLLVFSSGYYITQIIVDVSSCKLFIRRYDIENDRWQEWGNIIMT